MDWQKFRAGLQNASAGPPEPNGRTIGQKAAQRGDPSAVAWVKFGSWEVAQGCQPSAVAWVKFGAWEAAQGFDPSPPAWVRF